MKLPKIIQGGMGVAISNWTLARAVSKQGHLGVISGVGIALVMVSRLMDGDKEGHMRHALSHFPFQEPVQRLLDKYFVAEPVTPKAPYKRPQMWNLKPSKALLELTVISNFVEVFLAKEGHKNPVGINLLEKIQLPTMSSLYGAMLAGVEIVIMGAGIPVQIPGILDQLADHQAVSYRLDVLGTDQGDDYRAHFDPQELFPDVVEKLGTLRRPDFLPIISSVVLGKALIKRSTGKINGFIVEAPTAGGHNAPPRGPLQLNDKGEPIYGQKDEVDLNRIKEFGLPFWLASGYDSPEKLKIALGTGATGIQVGTAFGYCDESGMDAAIKSRAIQKVLDHDISVFTDPIGSPTGYPFKVVQMEGTVSDAQVYEGRSRICDFGLLRHLYKDDGGKVAFRCPSEPVDHYLKKGGHEEDTVGKQCLCNNLVAAAGYPQRRKDGYVEPAIVTAGDVLVDIGRYIKPGQNSYTAQEVIEYLTA